MTPAIQIQTVNAPRQILGGALITPRAWQLSVRLPIFNIRWYWSRPMDVLVERVDQPLERHVIVDRTRIFQVVLLLLGAVGAALLRRSFR